MHSTTNATRAVAIARRAVRRIAESIVVLVVVSGVVFGLVNVVPGDPGRNALGPDATAAQVAAWNASHGVQPPSFGQYFEWAQGFIVGEWGTSLTYGVPVFDLVVDRLGNSFWLGVLAFAFVVPIAVLTGVAQARAPGSRSDRSATAGLMVLATVPEFVIGGLLLVVFGVVLDAMPLQSVIVPSAGPEARFQAMILPAVTMALGTVSIVARTVRASIVDERRAYHYRFAELGGAPERLLLNRYVARNASAPTIALLGMCFGVLVAGSAVVETLFGYPGLGELLVTATQQKDAAVLTAGVVVAGAVSLSAIAVADIAVAWLSPTAPEGDGG